MSSGIDVFGYYPTIMPLWPLLNYYNLVIERYHCISGSGFKHIARVPHLAHLPFPCSPQ